MEVMYIHEVDEIPDSERARRAEELALAKKRKEKKRKEKKAAREAAVDEEGNPVAKKKSDGKTPKTHKKSAHVSLLCQRAEVMRTMRENRDASMCCTLNGWLGVAGSRRYGREGGNHLLLRAPADGL